MRLHPHALSDHGEMLLNLEHPPRPKSLFFGKALEGADTCRDLT
jgi:hypothetical protein